MGGVGSLLTVVGGRTADFATRRDHLSFWLLILRS